MTVSPRNISVSTTNVIVDDSADSFSHHWTLNNTAIQNEFGTLVNYQQSPFGTLNVTLTGNNINPTGSANLFKVTNTPINSGFESGSMTINFGSGTNSVDVQATSGPLTIQGHGGNDGVDIGSTPVPSSTGGFTDFGSVAFIKGSVTVRDTAPTMRIGVDDSSDTTSHPAVFLSDTALTGLAPMPIFYQASGLLQDPTGGTPGFDVTTGPAADTITVTNTPGFTDVNLDNTAGTDQLNVRGITGELFVTGFAGAKTVAVGSNAPGTGGTLANINGEVVLAAQLTNTQLIVDDSGDPTPRTVNMNAGEITGLAPNATIVYSSINPNTLTVTVNTGTGSNHVNVQGTSFGSSSLNVVGHGGNDTVTVGSLAPALGGTQANISGAVNVSNTTNSTALIVDDSGDTTPRTVTIGFNSVQFAGIGAPIHFFSGVKSVEVLGGTSARFQATGVAPVTPVTLHGGSGTNTLISGSFANNWLITGTNAGTLQSTIAFQNIQNLQGSILGISQDTFVFANQAGVTGTIVGGTNLLDTTLDYSAYTTPVTVNLKTHTATGAKGGVFLIERVTGGQGNNILVGNGNNILKGGSGRDILISGGGNTILQAGSGEAILIGAHYLFDTNPVALDHLMAEWSHTYDPTNPLHDYLIRVGHLEHGGGLNDPFLLNPGTVVPQPGTTTLITGAQLDFLITDPGDVLVNPLRPGEADLFV